MIPPDALALHQLRPDTAGAAPTRRMLLAILSAAPSAVGLDPALTAATISTASSPPDADEPVMVLWRRLDQALAERDRAIAVRDQLEAMLIRDLRHPRVRRPTRAGTPPVHAAEPSTVDYFLGLRHPRLRRRLKSQLR